MARKKDVKKGRNDSDSESGDGVTKKASNGGAIGGLSRKQKREEKLAKKEKHSGQTKTTDSDDEEKSDDEQTENRLPKVIKNKKSKKKGQKSLPLESSSEEEQVENIYFSHGKKQNKKIPSKEGDKITGQKKIKESKDSDDDISQEAEEVIPVKSAFERLALDDSDVERKSSKKKNKDKKEKKAEKKEKQESSKKISPLNGEAQFGEEKNNLDLELEGSVLDSSDDGKKNIGQEKKIKGGKNNIGEIKIHVSSDVVDDKDKDEEMADSEEIMYGAPDDKVWTDKSHAQVELELRAENADDDIPTFGADGKKLSNKERKKLKKEKEAKERVEEFEKAAAKASKEGAQFACSQTAVDQNDPHWCNSLDINIPSFNISAAGKVLFKDASLNIPAGRRLGFVAANGRGKSTLLKMIAAKELLLPPKIDFLYVEQEVHADSTPAVEAVLMADKKRWSLLEEEKALTAEIDAGNEDPQKIFRLQEILEDLNIMGSDAAEAKARRILYGLGFDGEMQTKATKLFSGGWRMRISLARALFIEPTLLMPTNHLDLNAVIWLDDYLQRWKKTLLIVSHDQDFLNSVCEEILHIEDLKIVSYKGNYDTFKQMEKTKLKQQLKDWEKQEKRLRELKRSGQSRTKATETLTKGSAREPGARANKKKQDAAIATGTSSVVAKELIKRPREYVVKLEFADVPEIARPIIEVHNVHFRYSCKHPVIFENVDFGIDLDSRICIVGPNGAGKSTLLKLLIGELEPTAGDVRRNPRLRMGVYQQHFVDRLPMEKTAVQHLRDRFQDEDYQSIRNRLGKYGLEGHAHEVTMRDLSGGQKARVVFVELSLQRPHVLLLEPTNNLDIETIDALIDAINEFNGGIVVVTHDARLIEQCNCTLWVVEKQGVTQWQEGFEDYKSTLLREMEEKMAKEAELRRARLEAAAAVRLDKLKEKLVRLDARLIRERE